MAVGVAGPTAVADAGASLVAHLEDALTDIVPPRSVVLGAPDDAPSKHPVVVVELVDVVENPHLRNGQAAPSGTGLLVDPADLALDLRYRVTVRPGHGAGGGPSDATHDRHSVVGHVAHTLHTAPVLDDPHLQGSLAGGPPIRVTLDQHDRTPDHRALAVDTPALHYRVSPVVIDAATADSPSRRTPRLDAREALVPQIRLPDNASRALRRASNADQHSRDQ